MIPRRLGPKLGSSRGLGLTRWAPGRYQGTQDYPFRHRSGLYLVKSLGRELAHARLLHS